MADRYAGIDWASEEHEVLVADEAGVEVLGATYAHDEKGLSALCRMLVRMEVVLVAIERPDGLLVERLLDAGLQVLPLHRTRSRRRVTGSGSRVGSPTGLTRSCCANSPGLIIIVSGCSSPIPIRRRRSGR